MDFGLRGKVALVAGSSRGLGRAVANELAHEGCALVLCSRDEGEVTAAAHDISSGIGGDVLPVQANLTDPDDVTRLLRTAQDRFGRIDVMVTNTGGPPAGRFDTHSPDVWREAVAQNLESVLNLVRGVLPQMKQRQWGRIINITSIAVKQPVDGLILSNSIRAAVTGFARTLANEVAADGVTVNNVMPGYTRTERLVHLAEHKAEADDIEIKDAYETWEREIPMGRLGEPEELAALVAFLASQRASYITGTSIPVDGGWIRALV
ncbi:MAG: SDR family oxidoreductase [Gemmatimonadetes bacterium]|nr:SDR family oxidoreductase [Gemmatimonadota bacterium]